MEEGALLGNRIKILTIFSHHSFGLDCEFKSYHKAKGILQWFPFAKNLQKLFVKCFHDIWIPSQTSNKTRIEKKEGFEKGFLLKSCCSTCCNVPSQEGMWRDGVFATFTIPAQQERYPWTSWSLQVSLNLGITEEGMSLTTRTPSAYHKKDVESL